MNLRYKMPASEGQILRPKLLKEVGSIYLCLFLFHSLQQPMTILLAFHLRRQFPIYFVCLSEISKSETRDVFDCMHVHPKPSQHHVTRIVFEIWEQPQFTSSTIFWPLFDIYLAINPQITYHSPTHQVLSGPMSI